MICLGILANLSPMKNEGIPEIAQSRKIEDVLSKLQEYEAMIPGDQNEHEDFVKKAPSRVAQTPSDGTDKPGFTSTGKGFVLGHTMLGDAKGRKFWLDDVSNPLTLGDTAGTLAGYRELTTLLQHTSFGTLAVLVMLASAVPKYLRLRNVDEAAALAHETATYNLITTSASGKKLPIRIAASVNGNPEDHGNWQTSRRGSEEYLSARDEVGAIFDDLETLTNQRSNLLEAIEVITQCVPPVKPNRIAKDAKIRYPALTWQTFALSTGPDTLDAILHNNRWPPQTQGNKVRLAGVSYFEIR